MYGIAASWLIPDRTFSLFRILKFLRKQQSVIKFTMLSAVQLPVNVRIKSSDGIFCTAFITLFYKRCYSHQTSFTSGIFLSAETASSEEEAVSCSFAFTIKGPADVSM